MMVQVRYGDLAQTLLLSQSNAKAKSALSQLSQEVVSGLASDTVRHLSGNLAQINAIDGSLSRLAAFKTATLEIGSLASASQTALSTIADHLQTAQSALLISTGVASTAQVDSGALAARTALEGVITTMNTRFGERNLFAGSVLSGPAIASYDTIITALEAEIATATSAADAAQAVTDWFDDSAGYGAVGYAGGTAVGPVPIAEGEAVAPLVTANDPQLRKTLAGLAMGALLDRGAFAGQSETRRELAALAGENLLSTRAGLTYAAAELGIAEERIATAATRNAAEATALSIARVDLIGIDPYDASTRLTDAESRLQLLYTLTSRLSNLSLVGYL